MNITTTGANLIDDGYIKLLNEWMNTYIYIAPVKQKSSEALAAE